MAENSKIEWTEQTWNPLAGCSMVSPGCHNCYAMKTAHRLAAMGQEKYRGTTVRVGDKTHWTGKINLDQAALQKPLKRKKPTVYFVNSMSDLFHESVPFEFIDQVFVRMALADQHTFQVLTKRPARMARYMAVARERIVKRGLADCETGTGGWAHYTPSVERHRGWWQSFDIWPLPNVWLGVSAEDQLRADERIPHLLKCPAALRFVSAEPLLGPIDFEFWLPEGQSHWQCQKCGRFGNKIQDCPSCGASEGCLSGSHVANKKDPTRKVTGHRNRQPIDWVIVGGESGPFARRCEVIDVWKIVECCQKAGVPVFVKQMGRNVTAGGIGFADPFKHPKGGNPSEWPGKLRVRQTPNIEHPTSTIQHRPFHHDAQPNSLARWQRGGWNLPATHQPDPAAR